MIRNLFRTKEIMVCLLLLILGCADEQVIIPAKKKEPTQCQGVASTYTKDLKPIFELYCDGCHVDPQGIHFSTYVDARRIAQDGTRLSDAINHRNNYKMPNGQPKLPDSLILKIDCWILND